ncbi:MAG: tyrosine-type recombinase/integrase, partial [Parvularcula sp.]|nr:tyrosine-type recombinase/integrase [Parvularcula sp.]
LWRLKYRFMGKEKLLSFGAYPDIGISAARELRAIAKGTLAKGEDPMFVRLGQDARDGETLKSAATLWHRNRECSLDPAHAKRVWSRLERDVFPTLGHMMLEDISPPVVLSVIRKIEDRGALDISRRAKQSIGQIYQFAIASGMCSSDPTAHLRGALKPRPRVKHMAKLPLAQLPELVSRIYHYSEEGQRRSEITKAALMFALLTWVRTKELRFAKKDEFEGLGGPSPVWRIGANRMKMGREHLVPLSRQAAKIAARLIALTEGEYVFPGIKPNQPLSENTMIYALYRLGFHSRQTVHGFRGLASTWANEQMVQSGKPAVWMRRYHADWVELQLAHSEENEVRGAYNSAEYLAPRRSMLQDWADFLDRERLCVADDKSRIAEQLALV